MNWFPFKSEQNVILFSRQIEVSRDVNQLFMTQALSVSYVLLTKLSSQLSLSNVLNSDSTPRKLLHFKLSPLDRTHEPHKHQNLHQQNIYWPIQASSVENSLPFMDSHFDEVPVLSSPIDDYVEIESRSYNPYLIEYHEESNTFTYNDPWDQTNEISSNDNEISLVVENHSAPFEFPSASIESEPTITTTPSSEITFNPAFNEHSAEVQSAPVEAVEHVPEVSFPHNNNNSTTLDRDETFSTLNFPNNFFSLENKWGCGEDNCRIKR